MFKKMILLISCVSLVVFNSFCMRPVDESAYKEYKSAGERAYKGFKKGVQTIIKWGEEEPGKEPIFLAPQQVELILDQLSKVTDEGLVQLQTNAALFEIKNLRQEDKSKAIARLQKVLSQQAEKYSVTNEKLSLAFNNALLLVPATTVAQVDAAINDLKNETKTNLVAAKTVFAVQLINLLALLEDKKNEFSKLQQALKKKAEDYKVSNKALSDAFAKALAQSVLSLEK